MLNQKQQNLVDYIIIRGFDLTSEGLSPYLSGMAVDDIIAAMDKAFEIKENLSSTELGKELL